MKTVRRNSKKLNNIWDNAHDWKAYTLSHDFIPQESDPDWIKKTYEEFNFCTLKEDNPGKYSMNVHSNEWYEFISI